MKFDGVPFVLLLVARRVSVEMEEGKGDDASVEDEAVDNSAAPIGNDTSVLGGAEGEEFDFLDRLGFLSVTAFHGSSTSDRRH